METFIAYTIMFIVISIFFLIYVFFRIRKIHKIEKNCQIEFKKILETQDSFSTKGSNCIVTFHKDSFQVKLSTLITSLELDNIKYSDISSVEYEDPLSLEVTIKIKLVSNFEIILGFTNQKHFKELEHYRDYFLTKFFLQNVTQK